MNKTDETIVLIPARMASTRLPGKPLAEIDGKPMIIHVADRARESGMGRVVIAVDDSAVYEAVEKAGYEVVMTGRQHQSGSDRIFEALKKVDPDKTAKTVINVQGDLPTLDPATIQASLRPLENPDVDIATLAVEITDDYEKTAPQVVKVVGAPIGAYRLRALYFTRATAPWGEGPLYHHIGLYTYRRSALERFVSLPRSFLEEREKLEQLRALEHGMRIDVEIVKTVPLGVDTPEDLEKARRILEGKGGAS